MENSLSLTGEVLIGLLKATLDKKASLRFQVRGFSMSPFIRDGDVVTVSAVDNLPLKLGCPIAFINPRTEKLVIHRLVSRNGNGFIIKGDNVFDCDGLVREENILGYVTKVERNGVPVRGGLGLSQPLIAFLSRAKIFPIIFWSWRFIPLPLKRLLA